uniref:Uncharacterized protein n=1 Tax=Onchocerca volvulus TaxID=6282 RepID=A0A8R1XR32_ONCVO
MWPNNFPKVSILRLRNQPVNRHHLPDRHQIR